MKKALDEEARGNIEFDFKASALIPPQPLITNRDESIAVDVNWPHAHIEQEDILNTKLNEEDQELELQETDLDLELDLEEEMLPAGTDDAGGDGEKNKHVIDVADVNDDAWDVEDFDLPEEDPTEESKSNIESEQEDLADDIPGANPYTNYCLNVS